MLTLALHEAGAAAGEVVHGRVRRPAGSAPVAIELVRLEHSPVGITTCFVADAELQDDGSFDLLVPDGAPPDVDGEVCSLHYVVRAVAGRDEVRKSLVVSP